MSLASRTRQLALSVIGLTVLPWLFGWEYRRATVLPREPGFGTASTQSCNTLCQEQQTDCALKCDQDADCIRGCGTAARDCVKRCIHAGRDAG